MRCIQHIEKNGHSSFNSTWTGIKLKGTDIWDKILSKFPLNAILRLYDLRNSRKVLSKSKDILGRKKGLQRPNTSKRKK